MRPIARRSTVSNIAGVSRPVCVFCWLTWYAPSNHGAPGSDTSAPCANRGTGLGTVRPQVRNTRINHADPKQLAEAMRIFRDSVPNTEYPVGTILQLVPFEAMVKHPREKFPKTNGWEFFALNISAAGTKIRDRGDSVVNLSQGKTCLSCHQPAAKFDFVCEKGHGCAPIPFNDQAIQALQQADARCAKK